MSQDMITESPNGNGRWSWPKQLWMFALYMSVLVIVLSFYPAAIYGGVAVGPPEELDRYLMLYIPILIFVLALNFVPYMFSTSFAESHIHLLILVIVVLSFYAFGWPTEMEDLKQKFAELSVILVLFTLSELALHLTLHAKEIQKEIDRSGSKIIQNIDATKKELFELTKAVTAVDLPSVSESMKQSVQQVTSAMHILSSANMGGDDRFATFLLKEFAPYIEAFSIASGKIRQQKVELANERVQLFEELVTVYLKEETDDIKGKQIKYGMELDATIAVPCLATNEALYLKMLGSLATGLRDLVKGTTSRPCFRAITNILPEDWYNWPVSPNVRRFDNAIDGYRKKVREILDDTDTKPRFERLLLLAQKEDEDHLPRDNSSRSLKAPEELVRQCGRHYLEIENIETKTLYSKEALGKRELKAVFGIAFPGSEELGDDDKMYPICSLADLGLGLVPNKWTTQGSFKIQPVSLKDKFLGDLHRDEEDSKVAMIERKSLDQLPGSSPDMLMVGIEREGVPKWLMAISSNLKVGEPTMLMYLITQQQLLDHLDEWWRQLVAGSVTTKHMTTLNEFLQTHENQIGEA